MNFRQIKKKQAEHHDKKIHNHKRNILVQARFSGLRLHIEVPLFEGRRSLNSRQYHELEEVRDQL